MSCEEFAKNRQGNQPQRARTQPGTRPPAGSIRIYRAKWLTLWAPDNQCEQGGQLARANYAFEKRQRDLAKKQKKEEKRKKKLESGGVAATETETETVAPGANEVATTGELPPSEGKA
jgi:hypothetical protein